MIQEKENVNIGKDDLPLPGRALLDLYGLAVPRYAGCALCFKSEAPQARSAT
jgi:hypothetical protein